MHADVSDRSMGCLGMYACMRVSQTRLGRADRSVAHRPVYLGMYACMRVSQTGLGRADLSVAHRPVYLGVRVSVRMSQIGVDRSVDWFWSENYKLTGLSQG